MSSKIQERQRLIAFIFVNTTQYPRILKNNIYHSNERGPPPFFYPDTNPIIGHALVHSVDKTHDLVVTLELICLLFLNIFSFNTEKISQVHKIQKKLCKPPCCCSNQPLSKLHCFLLDVHCSKWSRSFFYSCSFPMIVYLSC